MKRFIAFLRRMAVATILVTIAVVTGVAAGTANADPTAPTDPLGQIIAGAQAFAQQFTPPAPPATPQLPSGSAGIDSQSASPNHAAPKGELGASGDSYGSGDGDQGTPDNPLPPHYVAGTTEMGVNFCLRTTTSAVQLVARNLGYAPEQVNDHTCTSATASNVLQEVQFPDEGLQIEAFNKRTERGIYEQGGNPYFMPVFECILETFPRLGHTCDQAVFDNAMTYYTQTLPGLTRSNIQAILDRAPNMRNLAVPLYPPVVPEGTDFGTCDWFGDLHELQQAQALFKALNDTLQSVANEFASRGVFVVDPIAPGSPFMQKDAYGNGTDACSRNQSLTGFWLLRAGLPLNPANYTEGNINHMINDIAVGMLHPNTRGWQWMADLITAGFRARM
jgi:hypothetical protein